MDTTKLNPPQTRKELAAFTAQLVAEFGEVQYDGAKVALMGNRAAVAFGTVFGTTFIEGEYWPPRNEMRVAFEKRLEGREPIIKSVTVTVQADPMGDMYFAE